MTLERKAIRKAAACALKGNTFAGEQVAEDDSDRFRPSVDGPVVLSVYTLRDDVVPAATVDSPRSYGRDLELAVGVWFEEQIDGQRRADMLDDVASQVERVMAWLLPRLHRVRVEGEELQVDPSHSRLDRVEIEFDRAGRALPGYAQVTFVVRYSTEDLPEECSELADLEVLNIGWDFPPPDGTLEARDEIRESP